MLSPSPVILNEVKDLNSRLRIDSAKHLDCRSQINSVKDKIFTVITSFPKWSRFFATLRMTASKPQHEQSGGYHFKRLI
jgi:hypothetical protein